MRMQMAAALALVSVSAWAQNAPALNSAGAEQRLRDYVQIWTADEKISPATMRTHYADRVTYYGKRMTRQEVLQDKLRFVRTYPVRFYDIAPGSLRTRCRASQCVAQAVLVWRRQRTNGLPESGASALTLVFSSAAHGRIVRESATTLRASR
ncbi:MAG: hypothetical protein ACK4MV_20520 [Beijerinckiaceae bacterium]